MIARHYGIRPLHPGDFGRPGAESASATLSPLRLGIVYAALASLLVVLAGQTVRLALNGQEEVRLARAESVVRAFARPDIVDRRGRLVATDIELQALYADPAMVLDADEASERIAALFPDLDASALRRALSDRSRRYHPIKRGLTPVMAQRAHDLGLPGIGLRPEPGRSYPQGTLTRSIVGRVDEDNHGTCGFVRLFDDAGLSEAVAGPLRSRREPVRLSIDLSIQHAVSDTLADAMRRYRAKGAASIVLDITNMEILASASLEGPDAESPGLDRIMSGVYELGSIAKLMTLAIAIDEMAMPITRIVDVREPLRIGRHTITDTAPARRPLTLAEILVRSSNIGAGMIAREAGGARQRAFLDRLGLLETMQTEAGPVARPLLPAQWGEAETITISYGHGLAVAPLQFAVAAASLLNGGVRLAPTFLARAMPPVGDARVVSETTSRTLAGLLRRVVTDRHGTGRRADVQGFEVGGKTGTAEVAENGGYSAKSVITSFLAILPASRPRYLMLTSLFEPETGETAGRTSAGNNAAPTTARLVERVAPVLGLLPAEIAVTDTP